MALSYFDAHSKSNRNDKNNNDSGDITRIIPDEPAPEDALDLQNIVKNCQRLL